MSNFRVSAIVIGLAVLVALAVVGGCGGQTNQTTPGTTTPPTVSTTGTPSTTATGTAEPIGAALFAKKCAQCHGKAGTDNVPNPKAKEDKKIPGLATAEFTEEFNTDAKIKKMIMDGSKVEGEKGVKSMPAFKTKLAPAQIASLVQYIDALRPQ